MKDRRDLKPKKKRAWTRSGLTKRKTGFNQAQFFCTTRQGTYWIARERDSIRPGACLHFRDSGVPTRRGQVPYFDLGCPKTFKEARALATAWEKKNHERFCRRQEAEEDRRAWILLSGEEHDLQEEVVEAIFDASKVHPDELQAVVTISAKHQQVRGQMTEIFDKGHWRP